jgi:hypothetical protein
MDRQKPGASNIDAFEDLLKVWKGLSSIYASKGIDLLQLARDLVKDKRKSLSRWASEGSFDALCEAGCNRYSLVLPLKVIEWARSRANKLQQAAGPARRRQQVAGLLERSASVLEEFVKSLDAAVSDDFAPLPPSVLKTARNLAKQIDFREDEDKWLGSPLAPHPSTLVRGLRFYSRFLRALPQLGGPGMPYSESLGKYLLSAYVRRITGKFHDPEVSALIESTGGKEGYDETAHRMWRSRNYNRIHKQCSSLVDFLVDVGPVIESQG